jgi:hypothetical protein
MFARGIWVDLGIKLQFDNPVLQEVIQGILRYLTFTLLGLTHTCCFREPHLQEVLGGCPPPTEEEIRDIQHIESKDVDLFNDLLRLLEVELQDYSGTLQEFMIHVWVPHVKEARGKATEFDRERIKELGIEISYSPDLVEETLVEHFEDCWAVLLTDMVLN